MLIDVKAEQQQTLVWEVIGKRQHTFEIGKVVENDTVNSHSIKKQYNENRNGKSTKQQRTPNI